VQVSQVIYNDGYVVYYVIEDTTCDICTMVLWLDVYTAMYSVMCVNMYSYD